MKEPKHKAPRLPGPRHLSRLRLSMVVRMLELESADLGDDGETRMVRSCVDGPVFHGDRVRFDDIGTIPSDAVGAPEPPPPITPPAPAGWARTRARSSTANCGCAGSAGCGLRTHRSSHACLAGIPTCQ